MESKELAKIIYNALDDKKGIDIKIIDISAVSVMADYFIIAGASNINQVHAMVDNVDDEVNKLHIHPTHVEGYNTANWVLMDYGDVVVHVFNQEDRLFYDLERIWRDGRVVSPPHLSSADGVVSPPPAKPSADGVAL